MREDDFSWKYWVLRLGLIVSFGVLLVAVFRLNVIRGAYFKTLARDNRVYESVIPAARGKIVDRKGRVVAESVYQYFRDENGVRIFEGDGEFQGYKFEGKDLAYELKRKYPYSQAMSLVTGYVGKVSEEELNGGLCGQKIGNWDVVGRGGIEEWFDCQLRGDDGKRLIEVDARGDYVRELGRAEPVIGDDLELSLDAYWQEKIYQLVEGEKAVVIMSEPSTGKIISMVSSPSFDANVFSYQKDNRVIQNYLDDNVAFPLMNRAIAGRYHPGSVFKPVVATAGLEEGAISAEESIEDTGVIKVGEYSYANWLWTKSGATDGMVDMVKALKRSNDIYFYRLGERLGPENMAKWARVYGYGQKTGVELPGELAGVVPDEEWKMENKGEKWYLGNTYHMSIGQGDLDVTPLQVNQMTNVIANNGIRCQMTLLKNGEGECESLEIGPEVFRVMRRGMEQACSVGGTAWPLFNFKTKLACKTGTAEVGDGSEDTHGWLTAFAPADNPEISITVMVERGGEGSDVAAPIVGDILKEWFNEPETIVPRRD